MKAGQLILISAPSGAGKTSLVNAALARDHNLVASISHTTRQKRDNEADGVNYHFISPEQFRSMIAEGAFLEHAQVFDQQYGTAQSQVDQLCANGQDVVLEIDWQGADQVRRDRPHAVSIFILPPSMAVLRKRLRDRGQDSSASMQRRLAEAQREIAQAPRYQYIVVNDDFDEALTDILAIIRSGRLQAQRQTCDDEAVKAILSAP